mgnify:CR=1 FL=1
MNLTQLKRRLKKMDWQLLLILLPGLIWIIMFAYGPHERHPDGVLQLQRLQGL